MLPLEDLAGFYESSGRDFGGFSGLAFGKMAFSIGLRGVQRFRCLEV